MLAPLMSTLFTPNATDIHALAARLHCKVQAHKVHTHDSHVLTLHRLYKEKHELAQKRPVAYFQHGLLTNSELFLLGEKHNLPCSLLERGYDVWLGNNRGNKYSNEHLTFTTQDKEFWDFSIDEFAQYDIPSAINYILITTGVENLTYIGFSQGSSQMFASLSMHPDLNSKVNLFVALSPVIIPNALEHPIVSPFLKTPHLIHKLFGYYGMLSFVDTVSSVVPSFLYNQIIDTSLWLLFKWRGLNLTAEQKFLGYPNLYSLTSVKNVVHWFQIINSQRFTRFKEIHSVEDDVLFDTENITVPCLLIYGDEDILINMDETNKLLKCETQVVKVETYEHMDVLWAKDCHEKVFKVVMERIDDIYVEPQHVDALDEKIDSKYIDIVTNTSKNVLNSQGSILV